MEIFCFIEPNSLLGQYKDDCIKVRLKFAVIFF